MNGVDEVGISLFFIARFHLLSVFFSLQPPSPFSCPGDAGTPFPLRWGDISVVCEKDVPPEQSRDSLPFFFYIGSCAKTFLFILPRDPFGILAFFLGMFHWTYGILLSLHAYPNEWVPSSSKPLFAMAQDLPLRYGLVSFLGHLL